MNYLFFINVAGLSVVALAAWLVTGFDKTVGGESRQREYLNRALRCLAVVLLSGVFLLVIESPGTGYGGIPMLVIIPVSIGIVLRSALSEIFTQWFIRLVDPDLHGHRDFDPKRGRRYQDAIAYLIRTGQREQAIKLCEELKESGEVDIVTLENTLAYLGVKQVNRSVIDPLVEAANLRKAGRFSEAEHLLKSLLAAKPTDEGAAVMLMRLYAADLRQPERARILLQSLAKVPHVSRDHLEFAQRSIDEWSQPPPAPPAPAAPTAPKTVDELVAQGSFGLAVERLEEEILIRPDDVGLQFKLAEVFAVHCKNPMMAERIIRQIERDPKASPEQVNRARVWLHEWKKQAT